MKVWKTRVKHKGVFAASHKAHTSTHAHTPAKIQMT